MPVVREKYCDTSKLSLDVKLVLVI
jgi:hypothetical protein